MACARKSASRPARSTLPVLGNSFSPADTHRLSDEPHTFIFLAWHLIACSPVSYFQRNHHVLSIFVGWGSQRSSFARFRAHRCSTSASRRTQRQMLREPRRLVARRVGPHVASIVCRRSSTEGLLLSGHSECPSGASLGLGRTCRAADGVVSGIRRSGVTRATPSWCKSRLETVAPSPIPSCG